MAGGGGRAARPGRLRAGRAAHERADLPLGLFGSRQFSSANLASFLLYGALAGLFFLLPIQLQLTAGYTALAAGFSLLPLTVLTLALSGRAGALTARIGPRLPLAAGSLVCAVALLLAVRIGPGASYLADVLPVVVLTGIGVPLITPPITATVLSAVSDARAGIASAVNNGVARAAGLVAVAALPLLAAPIVHHQPPAGARPRATGETMTGSARLVHALTQVRVAAIDHPDQTGLNDLIERIDTTIGAPAPEQP